MRKTIMGDLETSPDLDDILAEYFLAVDAGKADPQAFLQRYPRHAQELARIFNDIDTVASLTKPLQELHLAIATAQPEGAATIPLSDKTAPPPPPSFGDYELLEHIGEGGMGVVYKAWQKSVKRPVALKMIRAGQLASAVELERFRNEAELVGTLDHTHIVPIFYVGEHEGRLYYTMKLIEGGNLARRIAEFALPDEPNVSRHALAERQRKLVRLMVTLARSVNHAHRRGILHRDLKPGNVLLDDDGEPHVTDFGLAQRFEGDTLAEESGVIVGTASYMSPEQAVGKTRGLTTAVDVYSLGAMFYELLTGRPPFRGGTFIETLFQVREQEPTPPRVLNPNVDRDLETICLKCLQKDPKRRYRSAERLAESLECWLAGKPIPDRPVSTLERLWLWGRRHPTAAGLSAATVLLLALVTVTALSVARARAARLEEEVLRSNVYAAQGVASTVLWHLEHLCTPVVQIAEDPELRFLLEGKDGVGLQEFFDRTFATLAARGFLDADQRCAFQSIHVLDMDGTLLADSPPERSVVGRDFSGRDYFRGALRHTGQTGRAAAHISRVYQSENDGLSKFAITVPVRADADPQAPVIGVVAATITTASTLGMLHLNDDRRTAVLLGRADLHPPRGESAGEPPSEYRILVHPAYHRGDQAARLRHDRLTLVHQPQPGNEFQLPDPERAPSPAEAMDAHYVDPFAAQDPKYAGRWLAGFAPVGNTEFVVIVQQRHDTAVPSDHAIWWGGAAALVGAVYLGVIAWSARPRSVGPSASQVDPPSAKGAGP